MTDLTTVGKRLKYARSQKRLRQQDVAERLGVHHVEVSRWERDEHLPNGNTLVALANLFAIPVGWLLRAEGQDPFNTDVSRGTGRAPESRADHGRLGRAERFEREMVRLGADDFEADHVRSRARSFLESVLSSGGTPNLTEEELDQEFELYLENNLRVWVLTHMKRRGAKPRDDDTQ